MRATLAVFVQYVRTQAALRMLRAGGTLAAWIAPWSANKPAG